MMIFFTKMYILGMEKDFPVEILIKINFLAKKLNVKNSRKENEENHFKERSLSSYILYSWACLA